MEKEFKETMIYKTSVTRKPPKDSLTTVYLLPSYAEVCINEGRSKSVIRNYRKIGGGKVINTVTGEIKEVTWMDSLTVQTTDGKTYMKFAVQFI